MALILGLDTGGTYTDAALLDADAREVVAYSKSLTTRNDLSVLEWRKSNATLTRRHPLSSFLLMEP